MAEVTSPASQLGWPGRLLFPMTLRKKTLLVVWVTLIALVVVLFFSIRSIVMGSIEDLERRDVTTQVQRVNEALDNELGKMDLTLRDWANPGQVTDLGPISAGLDNLAGKTTLTHQNKLAERLDTLDVNVFLFYNSDNAQASDWLWGQGFDEIFAEQKIGQGIGPEPGDRQVVPFRKDC